MSSKSSNVLIGHCFLEGGEASESERPLSIGGVDQVSHKAFMAFDYVALGHLHRPQFKGEDYIRYSGSIVKYSFSEQHHNKGVTLVEMDGNGLKNIEHLPLTPLRDMQIIEGEFRQILEWGKVDPNSNDYLAVRLTDRHAILDPMSQIRDVYPNVLQLEKPGMLHTSDERVHRQKLKRGEYEMFKDFFEQISGDQLTTQQDEGNT